MPNTNFFRKQNRKIAEILSFGYAAVSLIISLIIVLTDPFNDAKDNYIFVLGVTVLIYLTMRILLLWFYLWRYPKIK